MQQSTRTSGLQQVIEPLGVRKATRAMFVLFAVAGAGAVIVLVASGEVVFGLLFGTIFVGVPWIIHRTTAGPGVPGFTLTADGILGAAEDETALLSWSEVEALVWRGTGLTINDVPCHALHAELSDGRSVRITSLPARHGREVDDVEEQVRATGLLPERLTFTDRSGPDRAQGFGSGPAQQTISSWSEVPPRAKIVIAVAAAMFFAPMLLGMLVIPIVIAIMLGPIGVLLGIAAVSVLFVAAVRLLWRWRTPALACSFTVEGVVSDFGAGLTVPWEDGAELRIASTAGRHDLMPDELGRPGWIVALHRPGGESLRLSPVLGNPSRVQRAGLELVNARRQGLVPDDVGLVLAPDLPSTVADRLRALWG